MTKREQIRQLQEELLNAKASYERTTQDTFASQRRLVAELKTEHGLAMQGKAFEINHLADERVKEAEDRVVQMEKQLAVLTKENELCKKAVELNADIIDIKDLVRTLIGKLPEINISNLSVSAKKED